MTPRADRKRSVACVCSSLRERTKLPEDKIRSLVEETLESVGLANVIDRFPAELSGGMVKRAGFARAVISNPQCVLYDEPTTMVDPIIARRLGDLIQRLKRQLGFTSIVVTHDMRFAERLADLVLFLHEGRAQYFGPLDGFLASQDPFIQQFLTLDAYVLPTA